MLRMVICIPIIIELMKISKVITCDISRGIWLEIWSSLLRMNHWNCSLVFGFFPPPYIFSYNLRASFIILSGFLLSLLYRMLSVINFTNATIATAKHNSDSVKRSLSILLRIIATEIGTVNNFCKIALLVMIT